MVGAVWVFKSQEPAPLNLRLLSGGRQRAGSEPGPVGQSRRQVGWESGVWAQHRGAAVSCEQVEWPQQPWAPRPALTSSCAAAHLPVYRKYSTQFAFPGIYHSGNTQAMSIPGGARAQGGHYGSPDLHTPLLTCPQAAHAPSKPQGAHGHGSQFGKPCQTTSV